MGAPIANCWRNLQWMQAIVVHFRPKAEPQHCTAGPESDSAENQSGDGCWELICLKIDLACDCLETA